MSDITKCKGENCPLKETCWRFLAPEERLYQSYFLGIPYSKEKEKCEYYWEKEKSNVSNLE